jgi:hypothetical protein
MRIVIFSTFIGFIACNKKHRKSELWPVNYSSYLMRNIVLRPEEGETIRLTG